jgi:hypothetical protein
MLSVKLENSNADKRGSIAKSSMTSIIAEKREYG